MEVAKELFDSASVNKMSAAGIEEYLAARRFSA